MINILKYYYYYYYHCNLILTIYIFNLYLTTEVSDLFFKGDLAKVAVLQVSDSTTQHQAHKFNNTKNQVTVYKGSVS